MTFASVNHRIPYTRNPPPPPEFTDLQRDVILPRGRQHASSKVPFRQDADAPVTLPSSSSSTTTTTTAPHSLMFSRAHIAAVETSVHDLPTCHCSEGLLPSPLQPYPGSSHYPCGCSQGGYGNLSFEKKIRLATQGRLRQLRCCTTCC